MFFVGHISIAFILTYFISRRFQVPNVSFSLVFFLSILPDIDIIVRLLGIEIIHRSITHSLLFFVIALLIFVLKYRDRVRSSIIYFIAYFSHIAIGDIIVGPSNLLSPFGVFHLNSVLYYKAPEHLLVEGVLLIIMIMIVVSQYLSYRNGSVFPIKYSRKLDPIFYPIVVAAIAVSAVYLIDGSQLKFPDSFTSMLRSDDYSNVILVLNTICLASVLAIWIISRHATSASHELCAGIDERTTRRMQKKS